MKHRKSSSGTGGAILPFFTTVLVVGGVVGAAYLNSSHAPASSIASSVAMSTSAATQVPAAAVATSSTQPELALVTNDGVQVVSLDGVSQTLKGDAFLQRVADPFRPTTGADAANGTQVGFAVGSTSSSEYVLAPDHRHAARMLSPKSDGASVVDLSLHGGSSQPVVLRDGAQPVRDATIGVWSDSKTLLIAGTVTGSRCVYRVGIDGLVSRVAQLPDSAIWLTGVGSSMWYMTAQPGEGLESDPLPPSVLHRVSATADVQAYSDDKRLVEGVVASMEGSAYAVRLSDGKTVVRGLNGSSDASIDLGTKQAVLFLTDGRLILREGFQLVVSDSAMTSFTKVSDLPPGDVHVFALPIRLDELSSKP
jgi:hypothetical protein